MRNRVSSGFDLTKIDWAIDIVVAAEICHLFSMIFLLYNLNRTLYICVSKVLKKWKFRLPTMVFLKDVKKVVFWQIHDKKKLFSTMFWGSFYFFSTLTTCFWGLKQKLTRLWSQKVVRLWLEDVLISLLIS